VRGAQRHYFHAIATASRAHEPSRGELNVILLSAIDRALGNYLENTRLVRKASAHALQE
jgi:hypothetical protein